MKLARSQVHRQARAVPVIKFENHALTSFAGLVLFQKLFAQLDLKDRLQRCFRGQASGKAFGPATIFLQLIVHLIMGFRELRAAAAYRDDLMVHDSHGAREFILACVHAVRKALPDIIVEVRMDSAFFCDPIVTILEADGIEFTLSLPFERFTELKGMIESRRRWRPLSNDVSYFEADWQPNVRDARLRFLFIRTRAVRQNKEPIQLDLFVPLKYGHDFRVIVTNKTLEASRVVAFHEGRGSQQGTLTLNANTFAHHRLLGLLRALHTAQHAA